MPVSNDTKKKSNNNNTTKMSNPKPKRASKTNEKKSSNEAFQETRIGELATAKTPISPQAMKSSSAWQHASRMLKQQQMSSTLKSSEERDQDLAASERSHVSSHPASYGYDSARMGSASCWNSLQSIFMIPQGLAEIKASHATTLGDPNSSSSNPSGTTANVSRTSKFSNGQIEQTSRRSQSSSQNYKTSLSGSL
jgi:hypothetical protein